MIQMRKERHKNKNSYVINIAVFAYGRGRRIRTLTGGFGDRCATIDTIPLNIFKTYLLYTNDFRKSIANLKND